MSRLAVAALILIGTPVVAFSTGCGSASAAGGTPPTPVQELAVACPANVQVMNVIGASAVVSFPAPTASGGVPPYSISCTPASGTSFSLGTTVVSCKASDAAARPASCSLAVTLVPVPVLAATSFVAFGDSITNGEVQNNIGPMDIERQNAYPTQLLGMLTSRYLGQSFNMFNEGVSGELAVDGAARIGGALAADNAQVLLLLQGVLDMGSGLSAIGPMTDALRSDIETAKARDMSVFISTLLPEKAAETDLGFPDRATAICCIGPANDSIRSLAASEGVTLVDSNAFFLAQDPTLATLIGGDGLHPTVQGYTALATVFFNAIRAKLELNGTASPNALRSLLARPSVQIRPQAARPAIGIQHR